MIYLLKFFFGNLLASRLGALFRLNGCTYASRGTVNKYGVDIICTRFNVITRGLLPIPLIFH